MMKSFILKHRRLCILLLHALLAVIAFTGAFAIRFEGQINSEYIPHFFKVLPLAVILKLLAIWRFRLFSGLWKYMGTSDFVRLFKALTISSAALVVTVYLVFGHDFGFPRGIYIIDYLLALVLMGGVRAANRVYLEDFRHFISSKPVKHTIILGAGHTGNLAFRMLNTHPRAAHRVVAFLDDDPKKQGLRMHDIPVTGPLTALPGEVQKHQATDVVFAIPDIPRPYLASLLASCSQEKLEFHIMPTFRDATSGQVLFEELRNIDINDLLGRDQIVLDHESVATRIKGKRILITGAGGSIGSELARQVAACNPAQLILVEFAENSLFHIQQELLRNFPAVDIVSVICDIKHRESLEKTFAKYQPQYVYHAAAYKHVPLMEDHPVEAVLNNIFGTYYLARVAVQYKVERFVMISSDKAVRPTNVMGATKRYAELLLTNMEAGSTALIGVRFGNVLESNGSVIPTFRAQIANGGPVTVTHPEITRYFITIQEAVGLVLQAGNIGANGDMFVLDMGEPVRILDLARSMIELSGLRPDEDIKIEFTGLRPGEKLFEELVAHNEQLAKTEISKLRLLQKSNSSIVAAERMQTELNALHDAAASQDNTTTRELLWESVRKHDPDISHPHAQTETTDIS